MKQVPSWLMVTVWTLIPVTGIYAWLSLDQLDMQTVTGFQMAWKFAGCVLMILTSLLFQIPAIFAETDIHTIMFLAGVLLALAAFLWGLFDSDKSRGDHLLKLASAIGGYLTGLKVGGRGKKSPQNASHTIVSPKAQQPRRSKPKHSIP